MDRIEFLLVFVSIIFGFAISEYLKGVVFLIKSRNKIKEDFLHISWQILILLMAIQYWWTFYSYSENAEEDLLSFIITMSIPLVYFVIIMLIFPSEDELKSYEGDLTIYFQKIKSKLYFSVAILFVLYTVTSHLWMNEEFLDKNVILRAIVTVAMLVAAFVNRKLGDYIALLIVIGIMAYFYFIRFSLQVKEVAEVI